MKAHECYHCKQWIAEDEPHDCWTTTETALTAGLSEDLRDAWERIRETAAAFGDQRIYASHNSIMFARRACYFFVRPKKNFLEVWVFLGRAVTAPEVRRSDRTTKVKVAHLIHVRHRDEVEPPITDWIHEAYDFAAPTTKPDAKLTAKLATKPAGTKPAAAKSKPTPRSTRGKPSPARRSPAAAGTRATRAKRGRTKRRS